jgi:ribosomal protein L29
MEDDRFRSAATAPIFRKLNRDKHKAQLDERFAEVLTERFQGNAGKVDKYGKARKVKSKGENKEVEALREIYDIAEDNGAEGERSKRKKKTTGGYKSNDLDDRLDYLTKLSRGEISPESSDEDSEEASADASPSTSSGSDTDDDFADNSENEAEIEKDAVNTISSGEETRRLALQNWYVDTFSFTSILFVRSL